MRRLIPQTETNDNMLPAIVLLILLFQGPGQGRQGQFPGQQQQPSPSPTQGGNQQGRRQHTIATRRKNHQSLQDMRSTLADQTIKYTATAGMMPIKNRDGEVEARMFFTSYVVDRPKAVRHDH